MDIVERLRERAHETQLPPTMELRQAADEIELLRKERDGLREALKAIGYGPPNEGECLDMLNQFVDLARAALKETP